MKRPTNDHGENFFDQRGLSSDDVEFQFFKKPRTSETTVNSRMGLQDYRSEMGFTIPQPCFQFKRGSCSYGNNCRFSHAGDFESNTNWVFRFEASRDEAQRSINRTKLCNFFFAGKECPYGSRCHFLHEYNQIIEGGLGLSRRIATNGHVQGNKTGFDALEPKKYVDSGSNVSQMQEPKLLKTRLCIKWERIGSCPYSSNCQFAHGNAELHNLGSSNPLESCYSSVLPTLAKNAASDTIGFSTFPERKECSTRSLFKWNDIEKISRIYADWIDNAHLVQLQSTTVEN